MIRIEEVRDGQETYYKKTDDQYPAAEPTIIRYRIVRTTLKRGDQEIPYLLFYNSEWEPVTEVCFFLNHQRGNKSLNTILRDAQAMKLLYSFHDIIGLDIWNFMLEDINNLKNFLTGSSMMGRSLQFIGLTKRDRKTVNGCLAIYRAYLKGLKRTDCALFEAKDVRFIPSANDSVRKIPLITYETNYKIHDTSTENISWYITEEELLKIVKIIRDDPKYTLRDEIIVRLQWQFGLRIGEVLGLTEEDIVSRSETDKQTGEEYTDHFILIRNRASDDHISQSAKRTVKVQDKSQYEEIVYSKEFEGYEKVRITEGFYNLMWDMILDTKKAKLPHYNEAAADTVKPQYIGKGKYRREVASKNKYIFVNRQGRILTQSRWNQILREIYTKAGVSVNKDRRISNLNHRLRHGYAMELIHLTQKNGNPIKSKHLENKMRHESWASTNKYLRLNDDEIHKKKHQFVSTMIDPMLPLTEIFPEDERKKSDIELEEQYG